MGMSILAQPLSLYSIPAVWVVTYQPSIAKFMLINKVSGFDFLNPRGNVDNLKSKKTVHHSVAERAARLEAAHYNGIEILPLWFAAVLAGNYVQLDNQTLNLFSISFVCLRMLYNYVYANQKTRAQAFTRSAVWWLATPLPLTILVMAANKHGW